MLVGALVAAVAICLCARCWARFAWRGPVWSLAVGGGVFAAGLVGDPWTWPPLEDRARFFVLLLPLTLLVEAIAPHVRSARLAWVARLALCVVAGPILLLASVYLSDVGGAGAALWSISQAVVIFAALGGVLAMLWWLMSALETRTSACTVQGLLAIDALAAGLAVMLSGYFRAGVLGLMLATSIAGAGLVARFVRLPATNHGGLGMSLIGLHSVILLGIFFGSLSFGLAAGLYFAPLAAWTVELPRLRLLSSHWRMLARVACVAVPLIAVVTIAQVRFATASAARSSNR